MMTTDPAESRTLLQSALEALKQGDRVTAHLLAQQAAALAPETEAPWLVLAALVSPAESIDYAKKALAINPDSQKAQKALDWALSRLPATPAEAEVEPPAMAMPAEAEGQPFEATPPEEAEKPAEQQPEEGRLLEAEPPAEPVQAALAEQPTPQVYPPEVERPPKAMQPSTSTARTGMPGWVIIGIVVLVLIILGAVIYAVMR
jgi:hypothetical protein